MTDISGTAGLSLNMRGNTIADPYAYCPYCGGWINTVYKFCSICGDLMPSTCLHCGVRLNWDFKYCPGCGKPTFVPVEISFQSAVATADDAKQGW